MVNASIRIAVVLTTLCLSSVLQSQATLGGDWRADVHDFAGRLIDAGLSPGLSVAVVAGDRVVEGFGLGVADVDTGTPVDAGTRFYIASTTKALTATAVAQFAARGRLDLQAPVTRYLTDLEFGDGVDADAVTVHDLLAMTEGVDDEWPVIFRTAYSGEYTIERLIELMAELPASEDGRAYDYSNLPYNVLGWVLDAVDDGAMEPGGWKAAVRDAVLEPLGMNEVVARPSTLEADRIAMPHVLDADGRFRRTRLAKGDANLHAAGGHFASARSLARFLAVHVSGGILDGRRVLDRETVESTHRRHAAQHSVDFDYERDGWGYGWDLARWGDERIIQRFGGFTGYFSHMSFLPEHGIGVVVLVNGQTRTPAAQLLADFIYDRLLGRDDLESRHAAAIAEARDELRELGRAAADARAARSERLAPMPRPLSAYAGAFVNEAMGRMVWRVVAGGLEVDMGMAHARAEVFRADEHLLRLTLTGGGTVAEFVFDDGGAVEAVRWNGYDFLPAGSND